MNQGRGPQGDNLLEFLRPGTNFRGIGAQNAVQLALQHEPAFHFQDILPEEFVGLAELPKRITFVRKSEGLSGLRGIIVRAVEKGSLNK